MGLLRNARQLEARDIILKAARAGDRNIARLLQDQQGASRVTASRDINLAIEDDVIKRTGLGTYELVVTENEMGYQREGLEEDRVWQNDLRPLLNGVPDNVDEVFHYGCTEMINNCIDHSGGNVVSVKVQRTALTTEVYVYDDGVGIFRKIADALELEDERQSVLELAKGKFTTDPANHSGQGIFFTCRAVDDFRIHSGSTSFSHNVGDPKDWVIRSDYGGSHEGPGTLVMMLMENDSETDLGEVFSRYEGEDWGFDKTVVPVRLVAVGEDRLVSRSQAKRLLSRFDRFREVVLDFEGVDSIGQAFADEVFRVFSQSHPEVALLPIRTNEAVSRMIIRAKTSDSS